MMCAFLPIPMKAMSDKPLPTAPFNRPLARLRTISWRDLLLVLLPTLAVTLALGWLAAKLGSSTTERRAE